MARTAQRRNRSRRDAPAAEEYERRAREDDDDEEERPRRRRRRSSDDDEPRDEDTEPEDDDEDDDEEEERPRRRRGSQSRGRGSKSRDEGSKSRGKGSKSDSKWDKFNDSAKKGGFPERLQFDQDDPMVVKFLEDEPLAVYERHWVNEMPKGNKKSFTCTEDDDCPLCEVGHEPETRVAFNVLPVYADEKPIDSPQVKVWDCPPGLASTLRDLNEDDRKGPLSANYWEVLQFKQKNGFINYSVDFVKERDLEEDFKVDPLDEDEIEEFLDQAYEETDYVREDSIEDLEEAAGYLQAADDDDDDDDRSSRRSRSRRGRDDDGDDRRGSRRGRSRR